MFDFKRRVREWRAFRRLAKIPRIQVWPLYDQPEHVLAGVASLRCWCAPELEGCDGSIIVIHRDRGQRLLAELPDPEEPRFLSPRQSLFLQKTHTDLSRFWVRVER